MHAHLNPKRAPVRSLFAGCLGTLVLCAVGAAFTVTKNVNSGEPPVDKVVVFEKGKPADNLKITDTAGCKTAINAGGSIEITISGNELVRPEIRWMPADAKRFDIDTYQYLVLTCRVEGSAKQTLPNGKVSESRADDLWFCATLINDKGERLGLANLADIAEDGKTPAQMVTLKIPMMLFKSPVPDTTIDAVGFFWDKTRPNIDRNFKVVIDKISFAD